MQTNEQKLQLRRAGLLRRLSSIVVQLQGIRSEIYQLDLDQHKPISASSTAMLTHDMVSKLNSIDDTLRKQWKYKPRAIPRTEL